MHKKVPVKGLEQLQQYLAEAKSPKETRVQLYKLGVIYDALAKLMPTEGRDFSTQVEFNNASFSVRIHGLTPLGITFAAHCQAQLQQTINEVMHDRNHSKQNHDAPVDKAQHTDVDTKKRIV